jgi:hypothetical protein
VKRLLPVLLLTVAGCSGQAAQPAVNKVPPGTPTCKSLSQLKPVRDSLYYKLGNVSVNLPPGKSCFFSDGTVVGNGN